MLKPFFAKSVPFAVVIATMVLTAAGALAQAPVEMIMTNEIATTHWSTKIMEEYATKLESRSNGRIKPKVFNGGTLYKDKEALASLGSGSVHMVWPVSVQLESLAPQYGVINLPFALTDQVMAKPGASGDIAAMLSKLVEDKGLRVMGLMRTADLIFIYKDKAIDTPDALKGTKLRLTGGRVLQNLMREFGASPVSMPASEMAAALMQGAIDGVYSSAGGWEMVGANAAKVATRVPGMSLLTYSVVVDDAWLKKLPADLRTIIEDTTRELLSEQWSRAIKADQETMDKMVAEGGKVVTVGPAALERFRASGLKAAEDFTGRYPQVWKDFQAIAAKYKD